MLEKLSPQGIPCTITHEVRAGDRNDGFSHFLYTVIYMTAFFFFIYFTKEYKNTVSSVTEKPEAMWLNGLSGDSLLTVR